MNNNVLLLWACVIVLVVIREMTEVVWGMIADMTSALENRRTDSSYTRTRRSKA